MDATTASQWLHDAEQVCSAVEVEAAFCRLANEITQALDTCEPVVLCVMKGGAVLTGQLLPRLFFPLLFDSVQATRYHEDTRGHHLVWKVAPGESVRGRTVLLLDDILDEGHTLAAIRDKCLEAGAERVLIAVLADKDTGRDKPVAADFVGLHVPDRYVFGCGMDVHGWWRNLPAIYALKTA